MVSISALSIASPSAFDADLAGQIFSSFFDYKLGSPFLLKAIMFPGSDHNCI